MDLFNKRALCLLTWSLAITAAYQPPFPRHGPRLHHQNKPASHQREGGMQHSSSSSLSRSSFLQGILASTAIGLPLLSMPRIGKAVVDVGLTKKYIDPVELFRLEYPIGWYLSRRDTGSAGSSPAFVDKPSATLLVVADWSSGATASVVKTNLPMLVKEGMGWGSVMNQFGGFGRIERFEDILEGQGVAALLMRDRDGQLKVSPLAPPRVRVNLEQEQEKDDGFVSKLIACKPSGTSMAFKVRTPVSRVSSTPMTTARRVKAIKQTGDVLAQIKDASPVRAFPSSSASSSVNTQKGRSPSNLIRQEEDMRISKAKSFLRDDGTVLTAWVSADRSLWDESGAAATLDAILQSFDPSPH